MGKVWIRDDVIWATSIEDDPLLQERIRSLRAGDTVSLDVDGVVGRWQRMSDGHDGRPTLGLKPVAGMREIWARWRKAAPRPVDVREVRMADDYLTAVAATLAEWTSPEDEIAFRDL